MFDRLALATATVMAGGEVIINTERAFIASFEEAESALAAAISAQRAIHAYDREDLDEFSVCIALQTAVDPPADDPTAEPAFDLTDRLLRAGHGGQVLLSEATSAQVRDNLPPGCSLRSLGSHRLGNSGQREHVYQLLAHGLQVDFPPLNLFDSRSPDDLLPVSSVPFVGRDAELYALGQALEQALSGSGQIALLAGEPGIGKTRTAERIATMAQERGAQVLWGNCVEWSGAPAYWPWSQVLRGWLREIDDETLRAVPSEQAALVSQVVPEIRARMPALQATPTMEPDALFFRLLTATGAMLHLAANQQPLAVVLDDIHWADMPSLQLLRFLAQEMRDSRQLVIATYRDVEIGRDHPGYQILSDLIREAHCHRIRLLGLPKPQVARFLALATGEAQPQSLVDSVYGETEGNPFFVTEVVRVLAEDGQIQGAPLAPRRTRVPETVREAVGRRLDRLTPECVQALTVASVVGRDFDVRLLERTTATPARGLLDALDEALHAQLLLAGEEPGTYRFAHALVQDTLYHEIPSAQRARLHLAVGEALEESLDREPPWAELARHFHTSIPFGLPEKAANYSERAGQSAMAQFAWQAAATHFERALATVPLTGNAEPTRQCDLLLALGEARNRSVSGAGDVPEARTSFLEAFELARELHDGERLARAAVGYAGMNMVAAFGGPRQLDMLEQALEALEPDDSPLRVRVIARLAADLSYRSPDNLERVRSLCDEAVSMATRLEDPALIGYSLWARHRSGHRPDNLEDRLIDSAHLARLAEQTEDPLITSWSMLRMLDLIEIGNLIDTEHTVEWLRRFDERVRIPYLALRVAAFDAALSLMKGRYADASWQIERARSLWQSSAPRQHQFQPFVLLRDLGQLGQMTVDVRLPDYLHPWRRAAQAHRMALALALDNRAEARADYEALVGDGLDRVRFDDHWFVTVVVLAEAAIEFEDDDRAEQLLKMMRPYADRISFDGSLVISHGPIALQLGQLAGLLGRWNDARQWLDQALAISERLGLKPYIARSLLAQAELLARRNGPRDMAESRKLADRAIETAGAIGMHGLIPRISKLRANRSEHVEDPFGLTPRELDVLRLVVLGLSDREIGDTLFISHHTVMRHVSHILTKMGVESRTAAAVEAVRLEIVWPDASTTDD